MLLAQPHAQILGEILSVLKDRVHWLKVHDLWSSEAFPTPESCPVHANEVILKCYHIRTFLDLQRSLLLIPVASENVILL